MSNDLEETQNIDNNINSCEIDYLIQHKSTFNSNFKNNFFKLEICFTL